MAQDSAASRAPAHAKYPLQADRGLGASFGTLFDFGDETKWPELMHSIHWEIHIHVIVETAELLEQIEHVAKLELASR